MLNAMYYKETLLIAITLISTILADDYHQQYNEEVTPTSLDFFDAENTDEVFDPLKQPPFGNIFGGGHGMTQTSASASASSSLSPSLSVSDILTTMVPTWDPYQAIIPQQPQQHDDDDLINTTTTLASVSANEVTQNQYPPANNSDLDFSEEQDESILTTIPSISTRMKQGKQIPISNLKPHEALRKFVEDSYIRTPLAILIDTASDNLDQIKALWIEALRPNAPLDCVLLAYNASGVPITYNFTNTRMLLAGVNSIKESDNTKGNAFFGIIRAIELIPYDSAVFVSTALLPADINLSQYAATSLLKKRIRLYLNWFGDEPSSENETREEAGDVLGSVAIRSGGEVILSGDLRNTEYLNDDYMAVLMSENFQGPQDLELTLETTVSDLYIKADTPMKTATLETPNGEINLKNFNAKKPKHIIEASTKDANDTIAAIEVVIRSRHMTSQEPKSNGKQQQIVQVDFHLNKKLSHPVKFYLRLRPESSKDKYRVTVLARNGFRWNNGGGDAFEIGDLLSRKLFKSLNLVDTEINSKQEFPSRNDKNLFGFSHDSIRFPDDSNATIDASQIIEVDKNVENNTMNGRQQQTTNSLQNYGTVVEMGIQSQLLLGPGTTGQLYFEITNYRKEPVFHNIQVTGEQRFLVAINQERLQLAGGQTATVIVTVRVPPTAQIGTKDQITFMCQGYEQSSKMAILKVVQPSENQDTTQPYLHWNFGSRCDGNKLDTGICSDAIWSVDVTAHDWGTGLMRIQSNPRGIFARNSYTAGTTTPVTAVYSANCCQPRVTISAHDSAGNVRTATIDVRDIYLSEGSIAAIVLGALLLIILIVLIVVAIVWCCKRRRESRDLPTYRSRSRTST